MTELERLIHDEIALSGPVSVSWYMSQCLGHPEHGYYVKSNPFGASGDFVTAPEISQLFGEMAGLWLLNQWVSMGQPKAFDLVEIGPGAGTLMADILRTSGKFPDFNNAITVNLVETSPILTQKQRQILAEFDRPVFWHDTIPDNTGKPALFVANELFDALAIDQFTKTDIGWSEVRIGIRDGKLTKVQGPPKAAHHLDSRYPHLETGRVVETSVSSDRFAVTIGERIKHNGGAALIVDYGKWQGVGDTLQAVKAHLPVDIFADIGKADLTAHVDFSQIVNESNCFYKFTTQGEFLENMGITTRAQALAANLEGDALENLITSHRRLTHPDQMGELFKVLALFPEEPSDIAGFS